MTTTQSDRLFTLRVSRIIRASRERVFEAWVNPDLRRQWWVNGRGLSACDIDASVGGKYRMVQVGTCSEEFNVDPDFEWVMAGEFLELVRPSRIVFTWGVNHTPPVTNHRVTIDLREVPGGTELTLVHEGIMSAAMRDGTHEGWTVLVKAIGELLER